MEFCLIHFSCASQFSQFLAALSTKSDLKCTRMQNVSIKYGYCLLLTDQSARVRSLASKWNCSSVSILSCRLGHLPTPDSHEALLLAPGVVDESGESAVNSI